MFIFFKKFEFCDLAFFLMFNSFKSDVALKKCQIIIFNTILMATSAPCQQARHSVCHVGGFS